MTYPKPVQPRSADPRAFALRLGRPFGHRCRALPPHGNSDALELRFGPGTRTFPKPPRRIERAAKVEKHHPDQHVSAWPSPPATITRGDTKTRISRPPPGSITSIYFMLAKHAQPHQIHTTLCGVLYHSHFTGEDTEPQRALGVCPATPSRCLPKRKSHRPFWGGAGSDQAGRSHPASVGHRKEGAWKVRLGGTEIVGPPSAAQVEC